MLDQLLGFRLSAQQQRLWMRSREEQLQRACCLVSIKGPLQSLRFHTAIQTVVRRHQVLRTTYQRIPPLKTPLQCISGADAYVWQCIDLHHRSSREQEGAVKHLFEQELYCVAAHEQDHPLRVTFILLSVHEQLALISVPVLSADSRTFQNLLREIAHFYDHPAQVEDDNTESVVQYIQFAQWQQELLEDEEEARLGKEYWQKLHRLQIPTLHLPGEKGTTEMEVSALETFTCELPTGVEASVEHVLRCYDVPVGVFFLTCWQTLLWRLTRQRDIVVNTVLDGRMHEELFDALGLYTQTVPIACHFTVDASFRDMLMQVHWALSGAETWQAHFTEEPHQATRKPLFELEERSGPHMASRVTFAAQRQQTSMEPFNVKLTCLQQDGRYWFRLSYECGRFSTDAIERLAGQWLTLVQSAATDPECSINELALLSAQEQQQLLSTLNQTQAPYPKQRCIQHLFEEQVARTPDRVAVVSADQYLTYAELNVRANQLAHYLRSLAVTADVPVALCLERSLEMVVSLLGILKAGGAYVPLDPIYPQARLIFLLTDSRASVVITNTRLTATFSAHTTKLVCLDTIWEETITHESKVNLVDTVLPQHLAYIIYTSGSTGQPKGIMLPHQGLLNYLCWCTEAYRVAEGQGTLVHSPLGFDLTITSLFSPLIVGQRVVLLPESESVETVAHALRDGGDLSLVKLTPSHLAILNQLLSKEEMAGRSRAFIIGGEMLFADTLSAWREHARATRLINEYGPTETVVGCCVHEVTAEDEHTGEVSIGTPIANVQVFLLDEHLQPVPVGVPAELYIGGDCLARGYLNRPDLTAKRFVPHPFIGTELACNASAGDRLYRTGDLACYRPDGQIEYLGRLDLQMKLRGYRIEPGEIEMTLMRYRGVRAAVVLAQENMPLDKHLVAYVVSDEPQPSPEELRQHLATSLPSYMHPSQFILLQALPLTPAGKVDRSALPSLASAPQSTIDWPPRTVLEVHLAHMWQEMLHVKQVHRHDSFFALGGDSIKAVIFLNKLQEQLDVILYVVTLFDAPTVAQFADYLAQHHLGEVERVFGVGAHRSGVLRVDTREPIDEEKLTQILCLPRDGQQTFPLSFAQQRLWFLDQLQPENTAYLVPQAHYLRGPLSPRALERSLSELVHRHESLRTTFTAHAGQPMQIIHLTGSSYLPLIDLRELALERKKREARQLARQEAHHPCDLEKGPLLRTYLLHLDHSDGYVLLLTLHHIITDGWSNRVLMRELVSLYQAHVSGQPSPVGQAHGPDRGPPCPPPLPLQYADYALWQREFLRGEVLEAKLDYWTRRLAGAPPLELPVDYPRPSVTSSHGVTHHFVLSQDLTTALQGLGRQEGVTLFMLLLAAFKVLFYRSTGQMDIVVGTDSANRQQVETEGIIGFFVNLLVLRTSLSGKPTFREVLKRVREVVLGAYTHQDMPFELLVEKLAPDHALDRTHLIQALFVLQNLPSEPAIEENSASHVERETADPSFLRPREDEETPVKFDLAVFLWERAGQLFGAWDYRLDLFKASTIATLMVRFEALLQSIVKQPNTSIDLLEMLSATERLQQEREVQTIRHKLRIGEEGLFDL